MTTSWAWLYAEPNGVLAALTALQVDADDQDKRPEPAALPTAVRSVVLVMELALVSGAAFLLLLTSSVVGSLARALLDSVGDEWVSEAVGGEICEAAAFGWGMLAFASWFFRRPKRALVRRLARFGRSRVKACVVSVLLHSVVVMTVALIQTKKDPVLVSWKNVETAVYRHDGSLASAETMHKLLLAPMKEELFFRGVIVLAATNRLRSVRWSAALSSLLFAAIHLANARRIGSQYSASYVAFQVLWAALVGLFLALKLAVSGSLVESIALHVINNVFALGVSKASAMDLTQPVVSVSVLAAVAIYSTAIAWQLQLLRRASHNKQP